MSRLAFSDRPLVEAREVGLTYPGRTVLKGVNLSVQSGELVSVLEDYLPEGAPVHLIYPRDRRATPKLTSFIDFVIERFGV